jgi:hypothetical protein
METGNIERKKEKKRERGRGWNLADEMRRADEALGAPERVVQISAVGFELGGQSAVEHGASPRLSKEISHQSHGIRFRRRGCSSPHARNLSDS